MTPGVILSLIPRLLVQASVPPTSSSGLPKSCSNWVGSRVTQMVRSAAEDRWPRLSGLSSAAWPTTWMIWSLVAS